MNTSIEIPIRDEGDTATIYAGDYLNKLSGEKIERECRKRIEGGCKTLVVNFRETEIVNSIGVSILLGVIDAASQSDTSVIFSEVSKDTSQLFEMLGLTKHVVLQ
ncbi:MAG: STAS domain-containing protein [Acidobacteriota bacterium]|nr:STAS domain-containing protein [Acidobacteriota bacterium]MDH3530478.1 STAS domain-containing protein [Acidobacteriota bacterium]